LTAHRSIDMRGLQRSDHRLFVTVCHITCRRPNHNHNDLQLPQRRPWDKIHRMHRLRTAWISAEPRGAGGGWGGFTRACDARA
jgi:hypothetical protein